MKGFFATIALTSSIIGALSLQVPFVLPPGGFLDAALFAALGWGIWRFSRICAGLALALYLFEEAVSFGAYSPYSTILVIINVVLYLNGIRGAIAYHRFEKIPITAEKPNSPAGEEVASTGAKQSSRGRGLPGTRTVSRPRGAGSQFIRSVYLIATTRPTLVDSFHMQNTDGPMGTLN
jgi:hypothetical protein